MSLIGNIGNVIGNIGNAIKKVVKPNKTPTPVVTPNQYSSPTATAPQRPSTPVSQNNSSGVVIQQGFSSNVPSLNKSEIKLGGGSSRSSGGSSNGNGGGSIESNPITSNEPINVLPESNKQAETLTQSKAPSPRALPNQNVSKSIYDSRLNANILPTYGGRGTSIITPLTLDQRKQMDANTNIVSRTLFGDTKSGNTATVDLNQFRSNINKVESSTNKINDINKELDALSKGNIKDDTWTGSDESYNAYQSKLNEYQYEAFKLDNIPQTIGEGLGDQKQVPITNFRYMKAINPLSQLTSTIPIVGETFAATFGRTGEILGETYTPSNEAYTIPEKSFTLSTNANMRGTSFYSLDKGFIAPTTTVITPEQKIPKNYNKQRSAALLGAVGSAIGRTTPYLNPLGGYIFGAEEAGKLFGEVEFAGGNIKKGAINYAKTYPLEVIGLAAGGLIVGVSKASTTLKLNKYGKYVTEAKEARVFETKPIVNKYTEPNIKRPSLTIEVGEKGVTSKPPILKTKGRTDVTEVYPSNDLTGLSKEKRWLGKIRIDRSGVSKKIEEFDGIVSLTDGNFKQTVDYGEYKKVIDINKEGKGSIYLYDRQGNIEFSQKIKGSNEPIKYFDKTKSEGINIDTQINNAGLTTLQANGRKVVTKDGNRVVDIFGNPINPDLTATNIQFKGGTDITTSVSKSGKYAQVKADTAFSSDVVKAEARSGQAFIAENGNKLNIQKKVGQRIEFGEDKSIDTVISMKGKTREATILNKAPRTTREIKEGSSTKVIQFIDPKGGLSKEKINLESKRMISDVEKALKGEAKPLIKKIKQLKSNEVKLGSAEPARPLIVGGEGGESGKSLYQFNKDLDTVSNVVYVPETGSYLKGSNPTKVDLPQGFSVVESKLSASSLDMIGKVKPRGKLTQEPNVKIETSNAELLNMKSNFVLESKPNTSLNTSSNVKADIKQGDMLGSGSKSSQSSKERLDTNQAQESKQILKQTEETKLGQPQKLRELTKQNNKIGEPIKVKTKINIFPKITLLGKLSKAVDTTPDIFKIYARKQGKDILIGKETSLEGAKTKLTSTLSKTIRASGFIEQNNKKVKVSSFGNLGTNFGISKKDDFRLIELKNRRIKRGTQESSEIKVFRKGKKSKFF